MCSNDRGLAAAVDAVAAADARDLPTEALAADSVELRRQINRLEAEWLRRLETFDRRGGAGSDGTASTAAWVRHHCRIGPGEAIERVRCARQLTDALPATAAALAVGAVSYRHAAVITNSSADVSSELTADAEPILVEAARQCHPQDLRRVVMRWLHYVDREASSRTAARTHERRFVTISSTFSGAVVLDGLLAPEDGAALATAVSALARPIPDDTRSAGQRRADALVELARRALDAGNLPDTGGERPHITVTMDLATLEARGPAPAADVEWAGPICGESARRLACDAEVTRIITEGPSEVLDVGAERGRSRLLCDGRSSSATAAASFRPVIGRHRGATRTTSSIGRTAGRHRWTTWSCSAGCTTGCCTKADGK